MIITSSLTLKHLRQSKLYANYKSDTVLDGHPEKNLKEYNILGTTKSLQQLIDAALCPLINNSNSVLKAQECIDAKIIQLPNSVDTTNAEYISNEITELSIELFALRERCSALKSFSDKIYRQLSN